MADIQYLNYGDLQIELLALLNNLANQVLGYVANQPWSNKRKEKFMSAYLDIMNKGILGASNSTGQWEINVNGDIDLNSKPKKDREMYLEAAYFIRSQMAGLPTKATQEEEEKKKSDLPIFDNTLFTSDLLKYISEQRFGGMKWDTKNDWNSIDERDSSGKRARRKRADLLAKYLEDYSNSLTEDKYNYEKGPFKTLDEFKNRIKAAAAALRSLDESDDLEFLNQIGLRESDWFDNGYGDASDVINEATGQPFTFLELAKHNENLRLQKEKEQKEKLAKIESTWYTSLSTIGANLNGKPIRKERQNDAIGYLNELALKANLDGDEKSEIVGAFKLAARNNGLANLTKEELAKFGKFGTAYVEHPERLKKIPGVEGLYWDSIGNRVLRPFNQNTTLFTPNNFLDILDKQTLENSKEYKMQKAGERVVTKNGLFDTAEGLQAEDYLRMGALASDIAGTVSAFLPGYGTAASAALGVGSLGLNLTADWNDESVGKWLTLKNLGLNTVLAGVGLVPGLGLASKTGKWITTAAKWTPRILTLAMAGHIALDDDIKASLSKVTSGEEMTVNDWKNVAYAFSVAAGLARGARGIVDHRKYSAAFKNPTKTEHHITTKKGTKVKVTKEQVDELNKIGTKEGNEAANKFLNEKIIGNAKAGEEVSITFKTGKVSGKFSPKIKLESTTTSTAPSTRVLAYQRALERQNTRRKEGLGIYKFAPRFLPTSYDIYKGAATKSLPNIKIIDRIKKAWDPIGESRSKQTSTLTVTPEGMSSIRLFLNDNPELKNAFYPSKAKLSRETRVPTLKNHTVKSNLIDGSEYTLTFNRNTDQISVILPKESKLEIPELKGSLHEQKAQLGKWLAELNANLAKDLKLSFKNADDPKWLAFVKSIKDLKRKGYLFKQGGVIDKQKIQKYKEFIHK